MGPVLYAVPFLGGAAFAVVVGPVFITVFLLLVSGIPNRGVYKESLA